MDGIWEVYAVRYGVHERRRADNFVGGDPHDAPMPLDFLVWVLRCGETVVCVDTGFDAGTAARRGRTLLRPVEEALAALGVDHRQVRDAVITHMHYDHAGNRHLFPNARFHLQDGEMAYCTGRHMTHAFLRQPYDVEDVVEMVRRVFAGRVVFHDGDTVLLPGLSLHRIGGHTAGLQVVRVNTRRGAMVLASDASHFYANMEEGRPYPVVFHIGEMVEGWRRLAGLADSPDLVIPGHDPLVLARHAPAAAGLEGWIARLDLDPPA